MASKPTLSLAEKLDMGLAMLQIASTTLLAAFTAPFRGSRGHRVFLKHVIHQAIRKMNIRLSPRQVQSVFPTDVETYNKWAKHRGVKSNITELRTGGKGLWIGSESAEKVLVFFHGGGYVIPAAADQFDFLEDVCSSSSSNVAAVLLGYDLVPESLYPTQLEQAAGLVTHLVKETGKKPDNITLAGNSAGGALVLSVLSHILHPHPAIESCSITGQLRAALLVSPWISFQEAPSNARNEYKDITDFSITKYWGEIYLGTAKPDEYNQPLTAPESWWKGLDGVVKDMFVTAGRDETPFDDIEQLTRVLKKTKPDLQFLFAEGETHDQPFLDFAAGGKECQTRQAAKAWLHAKLE